MVKKIAHKMGAMLAAVLAAYLAGSLANSQFVIAAHDAPVSFADRFNMTIFDLSNMYLYAAVILIGFCIAFAIAAALKKLLPRLARYAYPIAGAAALAVILGAMYILFQTVPISGARSPGGFISQVIAGGIGGWIFAKFGAGRSAQI